MTREQLILATLTVLSSGVTSAVVTYLLNLRKAERDFRRTKLEALFLAVNTYTFGAEFRFSNYRRVIVGALDRNKFRELHNESVEDTNIAYETAEMLISIYFSRLKTPFEAVLKAMDRIDEVSDYPYNPHTADEGAFKDALFSFLEQVALLKTSLRTEAAKINHEPADTTKSRLFWRMEPLPQSGTEKPGAA